MVLFLIRYFDKLKFKIDKYVEKTSEIYIYVYSVLLEEIK